MVILAARMEEMESEAQNVNEQQSFEQPKTPDVGFPLSQPKPKTGILVFLVLGILVLGGGIVFFLSRNNKRAEAEASPTPIVEGMITTPSTPVPTPSPSAAPLSRVGVKINIQNGTGITGEAAYLTTQLKSLGYSDIKAGNADSDTYTSTEVTFAKSLNSQAVSEITKKLGDIYKSVDTKTSSTTTYDVVIITGPRKAATASANPTVTPTVTP
jgi:hypothetical protein